MYSVRTCFSRAVGSAHISWLNHIHLFEQEKKDSDRGTIWYWWRYLAFGVNFVIPEVYTIDHFILQEKYMESSPAVAGSELEEGKDLESSTVAECSELEQDKNVESGELGERPSQDDAQTFHSQKLLPVDEEGMSLSEAEPADTLAAPNSSGISSSNRRLKSYASMSC
jgi:hypothetical protein